MPNDLAPLEYLLRLLPQVAQRRHLGEGQRRPADPSPAPAKRRRARAWASSTVRASRPPSRAVRGARKRASEGRGRKRHLVVETLGMLVAAVVHSAGIQDRRRGQAGAEEAGGPVPAAEEDPGRWDRQRRHCRLGQKDRRLDLELVVRPVDEPAEEKKKFKVLKLRGIVERTFAWLGRYRRLSKDYGRTEESSESWIYLAMSHLMLRRLDPA